MNKKYTPVLIIIFSLAGIMSSNAQMERINYTINQLEAEAHLRFLTADELKGRDTGTDELLIAGRYIAEQFRRSGLLPLGDTEGDYLQRVPLYNNKPPTSATLTLLGQELKGGVEMVLLSGSNCSVKGPLVYLTDLEDYDSVGVNGKIVVTVLRDVMGSSDREVVKSIQKAGALSIIHLYGSGMRYPWPMVVNYFSKERMSLADTDESTPELPHLLVRDSAFLYLQQLKEKTDVSASIHISGMGKEKCKSL